MSNIMYYVSPNGDELAILPRHELDALRDAAEHAQSIAEYRAGRLPGLSAEQAKAFVEAPSPLAFWRKYRDLTQGALAKRVGVSQNYLSAIENGKRVGDVGLWLKLAKALDVPLEALVDEDN